MKTSALKAMVVAAFLMAVLSGCYLPLMERLN